MFIKWTGEGDEHIPIYVTRPTADGTIGRLSLNGRAALRLVITATIAAQLWCYIAIAAAILVILGVPIVAIVLLLSLL